MNLRTPKGTRDFYPEEMRVQNYIFSIWKEICLLYGYEEYESPSFEHLELYTQKSGDEIVSQLYNFEDKGGRALALRPEMTPSLARMVNQKGPSLKMPIRWFSLPRLNRYERAQKGRLREFFQLNMDIIGCESLMAEMDLISAIVEMLKKFKLKKEDFVVGISSRKLLTQYLEYKGLNATEAQAVYAALDKWGKVSEEAFLEMLPTSLKTDASFYEAFIKLSGEETLQKFAEIPELEAPVTELKALFQSLKELGYEDYIRFDPFIVRGLAYYTGVVFEVFDRGKQFRAIAGGGRYDNLMENLGGKPMTGVGFGIGDVVLYEILKDKKLLPTFKGRLDYYIASFSEPSKELVSLAQILRSRGKKVVFPLEKTKLKKQMARANDLGAEYVLFFGSEKAGLEQFEVKRLEDGEQFIRGLEEL